MQLAATENGSPPLGGLTTSHCWIGWLTFDDLSVQLFARRSASRTEHLCGMRDDSTLPPA
jgi:hypothetical protein